VASPPFLSVVQREIFKREEEKKSSSRKFCIAYEVSMDAHANPLCRSASPRTTNNGARSSVGPSRRWKTVYKSLPNFFTIILLAGIRWTGHHE